MRLADSRIARVVSKLAGLPEERLLTTDSARLLRLEEDLAKRVVGHRQVVEKVATVLNADTNALAADESVANLKMNRRDQQIALAQALGGWAPSADLAKIADQR